METPCIIMGIWRGQRGGEVGWLGLLLILAAFLLTVDLFINISALKGLCNATLIISALPAASSLRFYHLLQKTFENGHCRCNIQTAIFSVLYCLPVKTWLTSHILYN